MRPYVRKRDLKFILHELAVVRDPALIKIYAQLYTYRQNPNIQGHDEIEAVLNTPKNLVLTLINSLLLCTACSLAFTGGLLIQIFLWFLLTLSLISNGLLTLRCRILWPYFIIDELMEREWIKLKRKCENT